MKTDDKTKWVKADATFIKQYEEWKRKNQQGKSLLSMSERGSVPKLSDKKTAAPSIKRQGMLTSTNLTPVGSTIVKENGEMIRQESFRLSGDLMEYMMSLEAQNTDLQTQLEVALFNLKDSDLSHQKALFQARSQNDALIVDIATAMEELNQKDNIHSLEKSRLVQELKELEAKIKELSAIANQKAKNPRIVEQRLSLQNLHRRVSELSISAQGIETNHSKGFGSKTPSISSLNSFYSADEGLSFEAGAKNSVDNSLNINNLQADSIPIEIVDELENRTRSLESQTKALAQVTSEQKSIINQLEERNIQLQALLDETIEATDVLDEQNAAMSNMQIELDKAVSKVPSVMSLREKARLDGENSISRSASILSLREKLKKDSEISLRSLLRIDPSCTINDGFEWTPWFHRATAKALEIDLTGLKAEIMDLKDHRTEAYLRATTETRSLLRRVADYLPREYVAYIPFAKSLGLI